MRYIMQIQFFGIIFACLAITGVSSDLAADDTMDVFVSIIPQKYFTEKISGDLVNVHVMVPKGANPAIYEPKPGQMKALTRSKIYFAIGVPFESVWLEKFKDINPHMETVHTESGIKKIDMVPHHDHGAHPESQSMGDPIVKDPHVWTSPELVKIIAQNIYQALSGTWPQHRDLFKANYQKFIEEIVILDQDLKALFQNFENKTFMVFHPAWGYFAKTYGLNQLPVELEGKEPKPAQLADIIDEAKRNHIQAIFVQPQFSTQSANVIARAIKGSVVEADPLAFDWENNLRQQAQAFRAVWK